MHVYTYVVVVFTVVGLLLCHRPVAAEELLELLILHNNDMHSRFEETARNSATCQQKTSRIGGFRSTSGCLGGFARTAHEIRRYRRLDEEGRLGRKVLYLNAGDTYTGTAWFSVHKWKICADFLNILKPDAASLGNHEFDNGVAGLAPFLNAVNFPVLAANLDFTHEPTLVGVKKSVVLEVSGRKIGIVGHLTNETRIISQSENVIFNNVVESVRHECETLDRAGVKIIIVVGHSGYETDKQIAREVPLVDVVIGGHTNTFQWNGPPPDAEVPEDLYPTVITQKSGKKVPVVQAYAYTKYLGRLNVSFDEAGDLVYFQGQPELLDTNIPQDQDVLDLLEVYRPEINALDKKVVGKSRVVLDSTGNLCRKAECNFGNLMADAFVYYTATLSVGSAWNDYPIGLMNGGGIRTTVDTLTKGGELTRRELLGSLPFGSQVVSLSLKGSDLIKTLEIGVRSNGETSLGEFLQVSGLRVVLDMSKPTGSRVVSVKARCGNCRVPLYEPLDPNKMYNVTTSSFLTTGGDGHYILKENSVNPKIQDLIDVDVVEFYIKHTTPVYPEEEGRIVFINGNSSTNDSSKGNRAFFSTTLVIAVVLRSFL